VPGEAVDIEELIFGGEASSGCFIKQSTKVGG
jgi:hypothetical protein